MSTVIKLPQATEHTKLWRRNQIAIDLYWLSCCERASMTRDGNNCSRQWEFQYMIGLNQALALYQDTGFFSSEKSHLLSMLLWRTSYFRNGRESIQLALVVVDVAPPLGGEAHTGLESRNRTFHRFPEDSFAVRGHFASYKGEYASRHWPCWSSPSKNLNWDPDVRCPAGVFIVSWDFTPHVSCRFFESSLICPPWALHSRFFIRPLSWTVKIIGPGSRNWMFSSLQSRVFTWKQPTKVHSVLCS